MKTSEIAVSTISLPVMDSTTKRAAMSVLLLAALLMIFLIPLNAMAARQQFVLDFNDRNIVGYENTAATLLLKKSLKQQYPWADVSNMELHKVVLVAKSNHGKGNAQLRVGDRFTAMHRVDGNPPAFRSDRAYSFDRVGFVNPAISSRGPWQVDLKGNFIVRKVILDVDDHSWPRHKRAWVRYGR